MGESNKKTIWLLAVNGMKMGSSRFKTLICINAFCICFLSSPVFPWGFATHIKINNEAKPPNAPAYFVYAGIMPDGISVFHVSREKTIIPGAAQYDYMHNLFTSKSKGYRMLFVEKLKECPGNLNEFGIPLFGLGMLKTIQKDKSSRFKNDIFYALGWVGHQIGDSLVHGNTGYSNIVVPLPAASELVKKYGDHGTNELLIDAILVADQSDTVFQSLWGNLQVVIRESLIHQTPYTLFFRDFDVEKKNPDLLSRHRIFGNMPSDLTVKNIIFFGYSELLTVYRDIIVAPLAADESLIAGAKKYYALQKNKDEKNYLNLITDSINTLKKFIQNPTTDPDDYVKNFLNNKEVDGCPNVSQSQSLPHSDTLIVSLVQDIIAKAKADDPNVFQVDVSQTSDENITGSTFTTIQTQIKNQAVVQQARQSVINTMASDPNAEKQMFGRFLKCSLIFPANPNDPDRFNSCVVFAQAPFIGLASAKISGIVRNSAGVPQQGVAVKLFKGGVSIGDLARNPALSPFKTLETDSNGTFTFADVENGDYTVAVMENGFAVALRPVTVNALWQFDVSTNVRTAAELGDFDGDKAINLTDFQMLADVYGRKVSENPQQLQKFDLDQNGEISLKDFGIFANGYKTWIFGTTPPSFLAKTSSNTFYSLEPGVLTPTAQLRHVEEGQSFSVEMKLNKGDELRTVEFHLEFDPVHLEVVDEDEGNQITFGTNVLENSGFFTQAGWEVIENNANNQLGTLHFVARTSDNSTISFDKPLSFATIFFKAKAQTPLNANTRVRLIFGETGDAIPSLRSSTFLSGTEVQKPANFDPTAPKTFGEVAIVAKGATIPGGVFTITSPADDATVTGDPYFSWIATSKTEEAVSTSAEFEVPFPAAMYRLTQDEWSKIFVGDIPTLGIFDTIKQSYHADLDGDRADELIGCGPVPPIGGGSCLVYKFQNNSWQLQFDFSSPGASRLAIEQGHVLLSGDYNGDGKEEIAIIQAGLGGGQTRTFRFENNHWQFVNESSLSITGFGHVRPTLMSVGSGDLNKNGKDEITAVFSGLPNLDLVVGQAYQLTDTFWEPMTASGFSLPFGLNVFTNLLTVSVGDIDGDDVAEISISTAPRVNSSEAAKLNNVIYQLTNGDWQVVFDGQIPTDLQNVGQFEDFNPCRSVNHTVFQCVFSRMLLGDVNGDGNEELLISYPGANDPAPGSFTHTHAYAFRNGAWQVLGTSFIGEGGDFIISSMAAGDFDGNGKDEIFTFPEPLFADSIQFDQVKSYNIPQLLNVQPPFPREWVVKGPYYPSVNIPQVACRPDMTPKPGACHTDIIFEAKDGTRKLDSFGNLLVPSDGDFQARVEGNLGRRFVKVVGTVIPAQYPATYKLEFIKGSTSILIDQKTIQSEFENRINAALGYWEVTGLNGKDFFIRLSVTNAHNQFEEKRLAKILVGDLVTSGGGGKATSPYKDMDVTFFPEALKENQLITITPRPDLPTPSGQQAVGPVFEVVPTLPAEAFNTSGFITFRWRDQNGDNLVDGTNVPEVELNIFRYEPFSAALELLPAITRDFQNNGVSAKLDHLSFYVLLRLQDTTSPDIVITAPDATTDGAPGVFTWKVTDDIGLKTVSIRLDGIEVSAQPEGSTAVPSTLGEHILFVSAEDQAGNKATQQKSVTVTDDDTTPPRLADTVINPDLARDGATVEISTKAVDEESGIGEVFADAVSIGGTVKDNLTRTDSTYRVVITVNTQGFNGLKQVKVVAFNADTDRSGDPEESEPVFLTIKIDNTAPTTTLTPSAPLFNNEFAPLSTTYALTAFDPIVGGVSSGITRTEFKIDEGNFQTYESAISLTEGEHVISFRSTDKAGNVEAIQTFKVKVDATAPMTTLTPSAPLFNNEYAPLSTTYSLSATDPVSNGVSSGVAKTEYRIDDGAFITWTGSAISLTEGIHTIEYRSSDNVGNTEALRTFTVKVDATPPITTLGVGNPKFEAGGKTYIAPQTVLTLAAVDPVVKEVASGVARTEYRIDQGSYVVGTTLTLPEGIHTVAFRSIDNVGNTEPEKSQTFHVDGTPPVTSISVGQPQCIFNGDLCVNSKTHFTLTAVDPVVKDVASGVAKTEYRIQGGVFVTYTSPFTITGLPDGEVLIEYRSIDNVTNTESLKSLKVILDNTPPVTEFISPIDLTVVNGVVTLVGTVTDIHFEGGKYTVSFGQGGSFTTIKESPSQVSEDILATWDTTSLANGTYTILLVAQDCLGNENKTTLSLVVGKPLFDKELTGFNKPEGIFYQKAEGSGQNAEEKLYVADRNNDRVVIFKLTANSWQLTAELKGFNKPVDVWIDKAGNLYVVDRNNDRVVRLDAQRNVTLELKDFNKPEAAIVADDTGNIYVADRNGTDVKIYSSTGTLLETLPGFDHPEGIFYKILVLSPTSLEERLYVSDTNRDVVKIYRRENNTWVLKQTLGASGNAQGQFNKPGGLFVNDKGYLYVADQNNSRIQKFDRFGYFLMQFGGSGNASGLFNHPKDVFLGPNEEIYIADRNNDRIQKFVYTGTGGKLKALEKHLTPPLAIGDVFTYPNPFSPNGDGVLDTTQIHYVLSQPADVTIRIYNVVGKLVKTFDTRFSGSAGGIAGENEVTWDGKNDLGRIVANGVYILHIEAKSGDERVEVMKKFSVLK